MDDRRPVPAMGDSVRSLTWDQVRTRRLIAGYLAEPARGERMEDVVSRLCGLQAQVLTAAELGLGVRMGDITRRDVQAAVWEQRTVVKTYGPRGTIHLLPASEVALWIAAKLAVMDREERAWNADYDLDAEPGEAILKRMEVHVHPFIRLTPAQRELPDHAVVRIGSFLESPVTVTIDLVE